MKEFDAGKFREDGHRLIDKLADYLGVISKGEDYPVLPERDPDELYHQFLDKLKNRESTDLDSITD
ncbi:MAG: hypothetical protein QNK33_09535, partial [Bacteroidales bacterium]|nr:hypothetical protein [Bacteroidales bacterium]